MHTRNIAILIFIFILFVFIYSKRKLSLLFLCHGYKRACGIVGSLMLGVAFFAYVDFTRFWTLFHHIFFRNDLWLLNPSTDILIMMVPEGFFYDLVFRIVTYFLAMVVTLYAFSCGVIYLYKNKLEKKEG